jgi:uncharacterized protein YutE (UPF0331/DUF86 family)
LLAGASLISSDVAQRMKKMVGFRNVAVHDYQLLDIAILQHIVERNLDDFRDFVSDLLNQGGQR